MVLLHIGYPKAASTWLQEFVFTEENENLMIPWGIGLIDHRICAPTEIEFDLTSTTDALDLDAVLAKAEESGKVVVNSYEGLIGSRYHGGEDSGVIARRIADIFEGRAKVLIVVREQIKMIASLYTHYVREGGVWGVERFLSMDGWVRLFPHMRLSRFEYDQVLNYYSNLFSPENVLMVPMERLLGDHDWFCETLDTFIDRKETFYVVEGRQKNRPDKPMNEGWGQSVTQIRRHFNRVAAGPSAINTSPMIKLSVHQVVQMRDRWAELNRWIPKSWSHLAERRLHGKVDRLIGDYYRESNRRLQSATGFDLGSLGYCV